jgi:hypothetical protein
MQRRLCDLRERCSIEKWLRPAGELFRRGDQTKQSCENMSSINLGRSLA